MQGKMNVRIDFWSGRGYWKGHSNEYTRRNDMATAKKTNVKAKTAAKKAVPAAKKAVAAPKKAAKPAVAAKKLVAPAKKAPAVAKKAVVAAKKAAPVAKKAAPAAKKAPVAVKKAVPAAKKAPVAAKKAAPVAKKAVPSAKKAVPAVKKPAPVAKKPVVAAKKAPAGKKLPLPPPPPPPPRATAIRQRALTKEQIGAFKVRLAVELDYIKGNLNALTRDALRQQSESAGDVGIHSTHMADHGTDNFDRDINLLLASGRQEAIYAIEDALRRLEAGSFGNCEVCGNPIGFDRLNAMPYAKTCVECKKDMEKGRGRPMFKPYNRESSIQGGTGDGEGVEGGDGGGMDTE